MVDLTRFYFVVPDEPRKDWQTGTVGRRGVERASHVLAQAPECARVGLPPARALAEIEHLVEEACAVLNDDGVTVIASLDGNVGRNGVRPRIALVVDDEGDRDQWLIRRNHRVRHAGARIRAEVREEREVRPQTVDVTG